MIQQLRLCLVLFLLVKSVNAQLYINEVMSCNISTALDEDIQYSDWIEIYNGGSSSVNLNNYYLSDDADSLKKWKFPSLTISAGGFRRVWCSGKNRTSSTSNLHTNFSLKASGESIYLSNPSGNVIDNISFNTIPPDRTYGRLTNGSSTLCYLSKVTYIASNNGSTIITGIITTKPDFNIPGGMYATAQNIVLSDPNPTYTIRYTLDGSDPTENSPIYTGPINVHSRVGEPNYYSMIRTGYPNHSYLPDWYPPIGEVYKCNVIRARSFKAGHFPGPVKTETYFVDPNIFSRYGNLPLVSIVSDPKNLFNDTTGIYVPGLTYQQTQDHGNYHNEWDRPANIEIYKPNGTKEFNGNFKIAIGGESSESSPQKGLKVNADDDYGPSKIDYPIFEDTKGKAKYIQKFDKIKIRAWGTDRRKGLLHDGFCVSFMDKTDLDYEAYQPCVVFINGEYWGLQELRERNKNGQYYESHYYIDHENPGFDILKGGGNSIEEGDAVHWNAMMNFINSNSMTNMANYEYVKTQMDVDNFMLYFMFSIYFSRGDWPDQNEGKWRPKIPGGKWKWIQWDMDNTVANYLPPWYDMFVQVISGNAGYGPSPLFAKLIQNAEFKRKFINLTADYMNTSLLVPLTHARLTEKVNELMPYMNEYKARWQLNYTWQDRLDSMYWFLEKRPKYVKEDIISNLNVPDTAQLTLNVSDTLKGKIKINTVLLDRNTPRVTTYTYPWKGTYYKNNTVPLTAIPNPGFRFVKWLPSNDTNKTINYTPTGTASITAMFDIDPNYQPVVLPVINEAMNSNTSAIADNFGEFDDWIEIYNPGNDTINLAGYYLTSNLVLPTRWRIGMQNDSTKIPPHGYKLIWMDDDTQQGILHASFKLNAGGDFVALIAPDGETIVDSITIGNYSPDQSWGRATDNNPNWIVFNVSTPNQSNSACAAPVNIAVSTNSTTPCTGTTVNFGTTVTGNVTTWSWTGPNGFSSSVQNPSLNITQASQSGTYTVTATNACGNTSTTVQLNVGTQPSNVSASVNNNSVCTGSSVNLSGNASGTVTGWSWSGPNSYSSTTQNPALNVTQLSQGGNYIVTATNSCGSATASVQLSVSSMPSNVTASPGASNVCTGNNVALNASANGNITSWSWTGPNSYSSTVQNPVINVTQASQGGSYVVSATNSCGSSTASAQFIVSSTPTNVTATVTQSNVCTGSNVSLNSNASGNVTSWSWSGPNGYASTSQNPVLNITQASQGGNYIVSATNSCGSSTASVQVTVGSAPTNVTASTVSPDVCIGSNVTLNAGGNGSITSWSWNGPNGFTSSAQNPSITVSQPSQAGNYVVTATNGCGTSSASVLLNIVSAPSSVIASSSNSSVCTGSSINLSATANGTVTSWSWSGPNGYSSSTQNPALNINLLTQAGTYIATATNTCGSNSASVLVQVNTSPSNVTASSNAGTACIGSTVNLSASATGTVSSWSWTGPAVFNSTLQNPSVVLSQLNQGGNYIVTATNACGSNTSSVQLNVATIPSNVVASSNLQTICTGNVLNLTGSATGNISSWSWTGPNGFTSTSQNPSVSISQVSQSGNYAVVATNICGTASASVIITVNTSPLNVVASSNTNSACTGSTVNLSASATGAVNSWSWTGPNGFTSNIENPTVPITGQNQSGNYVLTVSNGCGTAGASVIVNVISPPVNAGAGASSTTACIGTVITLLGSATGQVTSWNWTGPNGFASSQQNPSLTINQIAQEGNYQVVATNNCGTSSASVFVAVNSTPVNLTASSSSPSACTGTSINLSSSATGAVTGWSWTGPAAFTSSLQNPVLNLTQTSQSGLYIVTATTLCGSLTASVQVTAEAAPSNINASSSSVSPCIGSHVDLFGSATGPVTTWSWIGPNSFSSSSQNPGINITQLSQAGNYIVVATNGCGSGSASVSINVNSSPVNVVASVSSGTVCIGNSVSLNATSGGSVTTWSWSGPNGFNSVIQNPTVVITQTSQAGSYVVTATNSCGSNTSSVQLAVSTAPLNVTATTNNASPCTGSSINLNGNSGNNVTSWTWSGPNGFSSNTQNPVVNITQTSQSGLYIVTATNNCGSVTSSVSINVNSSPANVTASAASPNACTGTTLNLSATSGGTVTNWNWSGPSGFNSSQQNPAINITQTSQAGIYIVTATNGCGSNTSSVSISVVQTPSNVTASSTSTTPCTGTNVNLSANASGNISGWAWTGPAGFSSTQQNPLLNITNSNQSGTYTVVATNSCGSSSASVLINVNGSPVTITAIASSTNTCIGNTISLNASSSGSVSSWSWTGPNGFTSQLEDPLLPVTQLSQAGVYVVTATSGCGSATASVSINVGSAPTNLSASSSAPSACIGTVINLSSSATGQVSNWEWNGPGGFTSTQQNPAVSITQTSQTGTYTVSATNNCGSISSSIQVYADSVITHPVASVSSGIACIGSSVTFQGSATGNVLTWDWTGPGGFTSTQQNPSLNILQVSQSGMYTVTVTNDCGTTNATVLLTVNDKPSGLVASSAFDSVCIGTTTNLSASAVGNVSNWNWIGPSGYTSNLQNPSINITQVSQAGVYTVTAENDCGSISANITLAVITGPSNPVATANSTDVCIGSMLELEGSASGDITSWSWSGPNGFSSSLQNPDLLITGSNQGGMYTLVVSDDCSSTSSTVTISVGTVPSGVIATVSLNNVCQGETIDLNGHAFGIITGWNWTGPNGFSSSLEDNTLVNVQHLQSGIYTVTASNNCGSSSSTVNLVIHSAPALSPIVIQSSYMVISPVTATDHVQWYYNNNAVQGNDNDSLLCQGDGDYYCIVTNAANCSSTSGIISLSNCSPVGIDDGSLISGLTVYPSPTNSKLWLRGEIRNASYSIEVLNGIGELVLKKEFSIRNNYIEAEFDLENFAAGMYVISIRSENSGAAFRIIKE